MEYVKLGSSNLKVSKLSLGAMGFGSHSWRKWVLESAQAKPVIERSLALGINFFDTCDFYSLGESERILGDALKGVPRHEVVIATKVGNPMHSHTNGRGYSRKHIFDAVDASLKRLSTDYIDLYQTHIWDNSTNVEELMDAFADVVRSGKVLYIGATTMPAWTFCTATHIARQRNLPPLVSMQCEYNPCHRESEREMIPFCRANNIAVIPFSPIARGFLSANRQKVKTVRTETDDYGQQLYGRPVDYRVFDAVDKVAGNRGISSSQVALAWTLSKPGITAPIFGATDVKHVEEAVAALSVRLTAEEIQVIDAAYESRPIHASGH
ncbi:MAG: aldo/keto reductase [Rhodospirillaceae bacterium]|nr:MAG: aldo/keto reductase [Rhodospirillaceae bacterium]